MNDWDDAPKLAQSWNALVERCDHSTVFQTYEWHRCWWSAYGAGDELCVVLAYAGSRLIGIAPMMIRRGILGRTHIHFIGSVNDASDYCDFIVDRSFPEALPALLDALRSQLSWAGRLDLSHFPDHSPHSAATVAHLRTLGSKVRAEMREAAPTRVLGDAESDRKAANKKSLRRHLRYFEKRGELVIHSCKSEPEILARLDCFFEQHKGRRALTDSPSRFHDSDARHFYRLLVRALAPRGWLRFDVVTFDGTPIAFHFGFEFRQRFIWYKPSFEPKLASRSPGEVLIKLLLEDAIARGLREFDFTIGAEAFKFRFANETRYVSRVVAYESSVDYCLRRSRVALASAWRGVRRRVNPLGTPQPTTA